MGYIEAEGQKTAKVFFQMEKLIYPQRSALDWIFCKQ